jgi:dienelactone hydrolase
VRQALRTLAAGVLAASTAGVAHAQELDKELNEEVVMIPKPGFLFTAQLETTLFKPDGDGPFPIVVINHGKARGDPRFQERSRPLRGARFFLQRGYVVAVPMRQGFSKSTGTYMGSGCNIDDNGIGQAEDVRAVLDYLATQPYADKSNALVVGQSHGGWTTLAFGTLNYPGVKGLVNFAGGLRQETCAGWEGTLARVAGRYAKATSSPSLWFYGDNDSYFSSTLFRSMHESYTANGGKAKLVAFGKFGQDAHSLFAAGAGERIWHPPMAEFLKAVGLPHEIVRPRYAAVPAMEAPPPTDFAPLDKPEALPYVKDSGRKGYATFLTRDSPRAFAIARSGAWSWANGGDDPLKRALDNCSRHAKAQCKLYAVDDAVVWKE